jgi:hypothetical protein
VRVRRVHRTDGLKNTEKCLPFSVVRCYSYHLSNIRFNDKIICFFCKESLISIYNILRVHFVLLQFHGVIDTFQFLLRNDYR